MRNIKTFAYPFLLIILFISLASSCQKNKKEEMYQEVLIAFDTVCSIQLFTTQTEKEVKPIFDEIIARLRQLELTFSPTRSESELFKFNASPVDKDISISQELHYVMQENLKLAEISHGAFNPCMGHLMQLWRPLFDPSTATENKMLPSDGREKEACEKVDYSNILLSVKTSENTDNRLLKKTDILLDLGASAKGYATDCIKEIILHHGIGRAIIDFGGNILTLGKKQNGNLWKVGIKMPIIHNEGRVAGFVEVEDKAVVTSGNYERFFEKDGKLYHHIISSKTGYPVENELSAVSIISDSATEADLLSTACFVLGVKEGSTLMAKFPQASSVFFLKDGKVIEVNNDKTPFHIIDSSLKKQ